MKKSSFDSGHHKAVALFSMGLSLIDGVHIVCTQFGEGRNSAYINVASANCIEKLLDKSVAFNHSCAGGKQSFSCPEMKRNLDAILY